VSTPSLKSHRVMVALDNMSREECFEFLKTLPDELTLVKVGLEMFNAHGADFVRDVYKFSGKRIFLDLKLHDIPNTVKKAMMALKDLPIDFLTVHLSGGRSMLEACQEVRNSHMPKLNVLGVSYLTSLDQQDFAELYGVSQDNIAGQFQRLFKLAQETQTQGIVCSAQELKLMTLDSPLIKVCPGIRFADEIEQGDIGDQKRVMTPKQAFEQGASYLVMGRSLTLAKDIAVRVVELNE
jgi:orotidine-5'-phosphate decarboxylase